MTERQYYRLGNAIISHNVLAMQEVISREGSKIFLSGCAFDMGTEEEAIRALRSISWALRAENLMAAEVADEPPPCLATDVAVQAAQAAAEPAPAEALDATSDDATAPVPPDAPPPEPWTPSWGGHGFPSDDYYYISDTGHICEATFENDDDDKIRAALGNCYRTRTEATARLLKIMGVSPREGAKNG